MTRKLQGMRRLAMACRLTSRVRREFAIDLTLPFGEPHQQLSDFRGKNPHEAGPHLRCSDQPSATMLSTATTALAPKIARAITVKAIL
jgi:hypothetical protein